jgi:hypothetical protein
MYYWNGSRWINVLRVFAGSIVNNTILSARTI